MKSFANLQSGLAGSFEKIFSDPLEPRTVVVVPSLSLDTETLLKIEGVPHYEERMLCMLMLLRLPRTKVIYVTSEAISPTVIDYFLHLLPGIPSHHARNRLKLFSCFDRSLVPLSEKILRRPRLLSRLKLEIEDPSSAHLSCFNVTDLEKNLALELGIPLYGCDPVRSDFGSKSGSRRVFESLDIAVPRGFGDLKSEVEMIEAVEALKRENPEMRRVVMKHNEGFSGEGNAVFELQNAPEKAGLRSWIEDHLHHEIRFEANSESWERYLEKFCLLGGIVEEFIEGREKQSPSVQCRVNPIGQAEVISTHDQVLSGPSGQVFCGCVFPAAEPYRLAIQSLGARVAEKLRDEGILGRFGVDFVSVKEGSEWKHYAIEINLRKGGTTHPFMMLQFLTDGSYDPSTGLYLTKAGEPRYYFASDNLQKSEYRGLSPDDLIEIAVCHELHFHSASMQGVVFHLIGALSEFGKLGIVCIGKSPEAAEGLYNNAVSVLDSEGSLLQSNAVTQMQGAYT